MSKVERRTLKMHPKLLWDVIHKQAGTIGKAILEGAMNSVDAGATFCDIEITRESFVIRDDGKGFVNDEEILNFFETFGHPHQAGDAKYGRFRMGRGQMMAFGKNVWMTNNYKMVVDLKPQEDAAGNAYALGYDFERVEEKTKGCHINVDLYDKLNPSTLDSVIREIGEYVKYVDIPVRLNGKLVSTSPAAEEWDEVTDDAFIKRKGGGTLDVYNQGVLVCKMSQYIAGVSGVVVSKEALEVNFARNDVQSTCKIWKRIMKTLKEENMAELKRNKPLSDSQRDFFARNIHTGEVSLEDLGSNRIVTDITNSHHPFSIFGKLDGYNKTISIAKRGDRVAEMAHTRKLAFVVTDEFAERFGAKTPEDLIEAIKSIQARNNQYSPKLKSMSRKDFDQVISSRHEPIADKELNKAERMALKALREANRMMHSFGGRHDYMTGGDTFNKGSRTGPRRISVGASDTALAWTDGTDNIWFDRKQLKEVKNGYPGMIKLCNIMLHEYLHNGHSTGTHEHGVEFYNRFHDLSVHTNIVTYAADELFRTVLKDLRDDNKVVSQRLTHFEDRVAVASDKGIGDFKIFSESPSIDDNAVIEPVEIDVAEEPIISAALSPVKTTAHRQLKEKVNENQISMKF